MALVGADSAAVGSWRGLGPLDWWLIASLPFPSIDWVILPGVRGDEVGLGAG